MIEGRTLGKPVFGWVASRLGGGGLGVQPAEGGQLVAWVAREPCWPEARAAAAASFQGSAVAAKGTWGLVNWPEALGDVVAVGAAVWFCNPEIAPDCKANSCAVVDWVARTCSWVIQI